MLTTSETARILAEEQERQQNPTPRLRVEVATDSGPRALYLRPVVSVEFDAWAWSYQTSRGILSVRGA